MRLTQRLSNEMYRSFFDASLRLSSGEEISVRIKKDDSEILLESTSPKELLTELFELDLDFGSRTDAYVRVYLSEKDGAFAQVFDQLGAVTPEFGPLNQSVVEERLWKSLILDA